MNIFIWLSLIVALILAAVATPKIEDRDEYGPVEFIEFEHFARIVGEAMLGRDVEGFACKRVPAPLRPDITRSMDGSLSMSMELFFRNPVVVKA